MSKSSNTNYPKELSYENLYLISEIVSSHTGPQRVRTAELEKAKVLLGGYSSEVPPLPIPNREVKLTNADGTAVIPWESR